MVRELRGDRTTTAAAASPPSGLKKIISLAAFDMKLNEQSFDWFYINIFFRYVTIRYLEGDPEREGPGAWGPRGTGGGGCALLIYIYTGVRYSSLKI